MNKLINKINQKENTIMVICILIIFACIIFFVVTYSKKIEDENFVYANSLNEQVISITSPNGVVQNINLKEFSYYVIVAEANTQSQALLFKENMPVNYWELKTSPLENVRALTKNFCIETGVNDNILYMEALENGISLTEEEEEYLQEISYDIYTCLTAEQVDATSIELSDICNVQNKIFLAEKYSLSLMDNGTVQNKSELFNDGTYYLDKIKTQYNIEENNEILSNLIFGSITVNVPKE